MKLVSSIYYQIVIILFLFLTVINYSQQKKTEILKYKLVVKDKDNLPVGGASIKVTTYGVNGGEDTLLKTNSSGFTTGSFIIGRSNITSVILFEGKILYNVEKEDFCRLEKIENIIKNATEINDTLVIKIYLKKPTALIQKLDIRLTDRKMNPIAGATVKLESSLNNSERTESNIQTDVQGRASKIFSYNNADYFCNDELRGETATSISYSVLKDGFYRKSSDTKIYMYKENIESVTLTQPSDYFDDQFLSLKKCKKLVGSTYNFLNSILLESYLRDCVLDYNSISLENFKRKNYLRLQFTDVNTYNSVKLTNYDIAKRVFDEVVRKLLNPLNDNLSKSQDVDGYCVVIQSKSKNFIDEKAISKDLVYKYYLLKTEVTNYKNNDITGQQLVDKSIILLNDERIDLKFQ